MLLEHITLNMNMTIQFRIKHRPRFKNIFAHRAYKNHGNEDDTEIQNGIKCLAHFKNFPAYQAHNPSIGN